ncbi:hypothetical protein QYE76_037435 [Lolium multiflorum]|uniref:Uncharacterized protein n=1 Tax=Lolium multiflorum TaxID=4521 RepID=A0AAD8VE07_LOLMU|nr:hypothetical protein QYE76_037435 [Lolium multiflorum]
MQPPSPAPLVGGGSGVMPPPSPAPSSAFPAPTVGGGYQLYGYGVMPPPVGVYYSPYALYNHLRYAAPPPEVGYYYTPFGGPWPPHYMRNDAPADTFEDEYRNGCCCSIQ